MSLGRGERACPVGAYQPRVDNDIGAKNCDKPAFHWRSPSAGGLTDRSRKIYVAKHHSNVRLWL